MQHEKPESFERSAAAPPRPAEDHERTIITEAPAIGRRTTARVDKLAREGAAAPALLLTGFGPARRHASLAAHLVTLEASLSDATLAMFEALVAGIFSRSKRRKETKMQDAAGQSAKLMRLFRWTISGMSPHELVNVSHEDKTSFLLHRRYLLSGFAA